MSKVDKVILFIIILIFSIPIILNEINEYNLRCLKRETLEISEILKNEYDEMTEITINKNENIKEKIKTRGYGKAFVEGENVLVILSYKKYCSIKMPGISQVSLSKSKCRDLELKNGGIILKDE